MAGIHVRISADPIEPLQLQRPVGQSSHGAEIFFHGVVRDHNHGRSVVAVSYDAFIPLGERVLREIATEALQQWGEDLCLAIEHRVGRLIPGELSLAIAASSRHRDEAYQASRYVIEQIKLRAPIWKKETYSDGESDWLQGHALCSH